MAEDIIHKIRLIKNCIYNKAYSEAMRICTETLESTIDETDYNNLLRERSHAHFCLRDNESACKDMLQVVQGEAVRIEDYYFLSQYLLRLGRYKESLSHINKGIIQACDTNDYYYLDSLHFNKLFSLTKLGERRKAEEQLEFVNEKTKYWIDRPSNPYTKSELEKMIIAI